MNVTVRKTGGAVVGTLIRGDNGTTALKLVIPRRDGGADLAELAWSVQIRNADGATDAYVPKEVHAGEREITFDWRPGSVATAAVGVTEFMVQGVLDADDPPVWQSATYYLKIDDRIDADPPEGLTELQKLIVYVQAELPDVLAARDEAREAARIADETTIAANEAALRATVSANTADAATARANEAAASAEDAVVRANPVIVAAGNAAASANAAATAASEATENANAAASAAFNASAGANSAAGSANTAASRAEDAAAKAENNAERASAAADDADIATTAANEAAEAANAAAGLANVAAERAENAVAAIADAAPVIVDGRRGTAIAVSDAAERPLQGLQVFGRTTQDGTPSPDSIAELVSVGGAGNVEITLEGGAEAARQSFILPTPDGLPGIPVNREGNYTDANGRRWVCDEIDLARGVYIQRIARITFDNIIVERNERPVGRGIMRFDMEQHNNKWLPKPHANAGLEGMCNALAYSGTVTGGNTVDNAICAYSGGGLFARCDKYTSAEDFKAAAVANGWEVLYTMATPVEIPLDAETIAAYRALHTCKPDTTISNDAAAYMAVQYAVDTKLYIDTKFAELSAAIIGN